MLLGAFSSASGAEIVWSAPTTMVGDSDVSTEGTAVAAFNFGTVGGTTTINGVSFLNVATEAWTNNAPTYVVGSGAGSLTLAGHTLFSAAVFSVGNAPYSQLSASYQTLLGSAVWNDGMNRQISISIEGLTIGHEYEVQFWTNDPRNFGVTRDTVFDAVNGVTLEQNTGAGFGGVGQWVIGSFTADGTTQSIIANSTGATMINAYQLRTHSAIPEPGTYAALAGAGAFVAAIFFRRRSPSVHRSAF